MMKAIDRTHGDSLFHGRTTDIPFLVKNNFRVGYAAEWKLRSDFVTHMSNQIGLIIGKNGAHLSGIRNELNNKHNAKDAVLGIWGQQLDNGDFVFSVYGNNDAAILEAICAIEFKADDIMKQFGWYVYQTPLQVVAKRLVTRWNTSREFGTAVENDDRLYKVDIEEVCFQQCPPGTPYNTSWCGGWTPILKELMH